MKEKEREYHRKYYHKNKRYREGLLLYYKIRRAKKAASILRDCFQVKKAKSLGNSSCVLLPKNWEGRDVLCIDNRFFMSQIFKSRGSKT